MKKSILIFLSMFISLFANAANVEIDGIYYKLFPKEGRAEVAPHPKNLYADSILIPEKVTFEGTDYQVTAIGEQAFFCCDRVFSVSMPNTISSIGRSAFWGCSFDTIAIPELVTQIEGNLFATCPRLRHVELHDGITSIGNSAFNSCYSLDTLILPRGLETIEDWAFAHCKKLCYVDIPPSLNYVGQGVFGECSSSMSVQISDLSSWCKIYFADPKANPLAYSKKLVVNGEEITDLVIPEDVTSIGSRTFYHCENITSVTITPQVTAIGEGAFTNCTKITSVTCYPRKVPQIGSYSFNKDAIENAVLYVASSSVSKYQERAPWNGFKEIIPIDFPKHLLSYYVDGALYKSYTLEEGEEIIPEPAPEKDGYTFSGWSEIPEAMPEHDVTVTGTFTLTSLQLSSDGISYTLWVKTKTADVSGMASGGTTSGRLNIPSTVSKDGTDYVVTSIADYAFAGRESLVSVVIPESVSFIGKEAFSGCKLQNVFAKNVAVRLESSAFSPAAYNHAMLYIPTDEWSAAVYGGDLWRFINIRETATGVDELSPVIAYTLMDAKTFSYVVYDAVNDDVRTVSAYFNVDENSPNNSWQVYNQEGMDFLYNIGAKKHAVVDANGKIALTDMPTPLNLANGKEGVVIDGATQKQWNFVQNDKVGVNQSFLVGIEAATKPTSDAVGYYLPNGMNAKSPFKGVVIVKLKDGSVRKILK